MEKNLLDYVITNATRGDPASVIDAIDHYGQHAQKMIHVGREKGKILDKAVRDSKAQRVLELGTNYGYSAIRIAMHLETSATLYTVEIDDDLAQTASEIINYSGLASKINIICADSNETIAGFSEPFDLIFVDHYADNYLPDLLLLEKLKLVQPDTVIISDNVVMFEDELKPYLDHLRDNGKYESTLHQPIAGRDGMEVSIRINSA